MVLVIVNPDVILDIVCWKASDVLMDQIDCRFTCYPTLTYSGWESYHIPFMDKI